MVENTDKALAIACKELGCEVKDYTVATNFYGRQRKGMNG
jgi:hypothetical protein